MSDEFYGFDDEDFDCCDDDLEPCSICSCIIGSEVGYGDTWDGEWVCENCVNGFENWPESGKEETHGVS